MLKNYKNGVPFQLVLNAPSHPLQGWTLGKQLKRTTSLVCNHPPTGWNTEWNLRDPYFIVHISQCVVFLMCVVLSLIFWFATAQWHLWVSLWMVQPQWAAASVCLGHPKHSGFWQFAPNSALHFQSHRLARILGSPKLTFQTPPVTTKTSATPYSSIITDLWVSTHIRICLKY